MNKSNTDGNKTNTNQYSLEKLIVKTLDSVKGDDIVSRLMMLMVMLMLMLMLMLVRFRIDRQKDVCMDSQPHLQKVIESLIIIISHKR